MSDLRLTLACWDYDRTRALADGSVRAEGIDLTFLPLSVEETFFRMLRNREFHVAEMSLSSLIIATARGDNSWVALPIYTSRKFFHSNILIRADKGIRTPQDLRGKRVGVPEYQQTAALWSRGVLAHEFGVQAQDIEWFMERGPEKSHGGVTGFKPPPGVRLNTIDPKTNIGEMLLNDQLDATVLYLTSRNLVDRSTIDLDAHPIIQPLFPDPRAEGRRYFAKTGIYPINHTVVIKREVYEKHPWLALNLFHCFMAAKNEVEHETADTLKDYFDTGLMDPAGASAMKLDPKAYGMKASRPVVETIARYVHEQGLTDRVVQVEEMFAPSTLEV